MIKAIIFDFGGVLVRTHDRSSRIKWEHKLGLADRESDEIVFNSEMGLKAQLGEISNDQLWDWVGNHLNLDSSQLRQFHSDFWAGDVLDRQLVAYINAIRSTYRIAMISNATDALRDSLVEKYDIARHFHPIIISAEEKIMKPEREIYKRALKMIGLRPDETVFIDDSLPNVEAAQDIGIKAIHFNTTSKLINTLSELGIKGGSDEHN